jgi:hypothetical protein
VDRVLRCECGFEARASDEEGLVAEVRRHANETHGMALSHDDALLLAFRAELDQHTGRSPSSPDSDTDEEER